MLKTGVLAIQMVCRTYTCTGIHYEYEQTEKLFGILLLTVLFTRLFGDNGPHRKNVPSMFCNVLCPSNETRQHTQREARDNLFADVINFTAGALK